MEHFDADIRDSVVVKIIHGSWKREDRNKQGIDDACARRANLQAIQAYLPDTYGTHHTKMIVLFRRDSIAEIIIHTANMQAGDWMHATQAVWRSPELKEGGSPPSSTPQPSHEPGLGSGPRFKIDLVRYLRAYGKKLEALVQELQKYDFSSIRGALVASVPSKVRGPFEEGADTIARGHPAMYHIVRHIAHQRRTREGVGAALTPLQRQNHIVCQCSSVARLRAGWLQEILYEITKHDGPTKRDKYQRIEVSEANAVKFSVVYPTEADIGNSLDGYGCGSSIHMNIQSVGHQKQVEALRPHLCRWTRGHGMHALRDEAAPHIKTYINFRKEPTAMNPTPVINWALLTSANLSIQAWGTEAKMPAENGRKSKFNDAEAEVHVQSFELGVLVWPELWAPDVMGPDMMPLQPAQPCAMVPVFGKDLPDTADVPVEVDRYGHAVTSSIVVGMRMPYDLPLTPYTPDDVPWSPNVPHSTPDRYGMTWPR